MHALPCGLCWEGRHVAVRGAVDMGAYEIPGIQGTFFRLY
jgi:hypothetical protein